MWSFGYTDPFVENGPKDEFWGESPSFVTAVSELYDNVLKLASEAESYMDDHFAEVLADISDIMCDPAYREDPDQWEDMEFTDHIGEIVYYVMETE